MNAKSGLARATKLAESFGCSLDATYTGAANGWMITLDAPEGKVFKGLDTTCDCNIFGNGLTNADMDWDRVEQGILEAIGEGFDDQAA